MHNWPLYIQRTKTKEPSPLLKEALTHIVKLQRALDLGAGGLADTRYLLERGFESIDVVDIEPTVQEVAEELHDPEGVVKIHICTFNNFEFKESAYDLVNAQNALPFAGPENIWQVMDLLEGSLKPGGVFCGTFFGPEEEWTRGSQIASLTLEQVQNFFDNERWILHKIHEDRSVRKTAAGNEKQWHIFGVIATRA
ncbi:MAG TPA: class I SAM-dependent methyltransferase [Candidatus Paceibacterota bacterium]|nr:class I SAM-dependent methyltransferase [Candidatus Paceibacterota bacterium]